MNTLRFVNHSVPATIDAVAPEYPEQPICSVTGLPARYKDPLTGSAYASLDAFRMLRGKTGRGTAVRQNSGLSAAMSHSPASGNVGAAH